MKVKAGKGFHNVFGADDLLRYFPELNSEGVEVRLLEDGFYYIFKQGKQQGDSCFFSQEEIDNYMIVVDA